MAAAGALALIVEMPAVIITFHRHNMKGFTLIELLVVGAIGALLSGFGFSGYRAFIQHRAVRLTANALYSRLALLRSQARNGVRERTCSELVRYEVKWQSPNLYFRQICRNWQQAWQPVATGWLVGKVAVSFSDGDDNQMFSFEPLSGRLEDIASDPAVFSIRSADSCRQIELYKNGNISLKSC